MPDVITPGRIELPASSAAALRLLSRRNNGDDLPTAATATAEARVDPLTQQCISRAAEEIRTAVDAGLVRASRVRSTVKGIAAPTALLNSVAAQLVSPTRDAARASGPPCKLIEVMTANVVSVAAAAVAGTSSAAALQRSVATLSRAIELERNRRGTLVSASGTAARELELVSEALRTTRERAARLDPVASHAEALRDTLVLAGDVVGRTATHLRFALSDLLEADDLTEELLQWEVQAGDTDGSDSGPVRAAAPAATSMRRIAEAADAVFLRPVRSAASAVGVASAVVDDIERAHARDEALTACRSAISVASARLTLLRARRGGDNSSTASDSTGVQRDLPSMASVEAALNDASAAVAAAAVAVAAADTHLPVKRRLTGVDAVLSPSLTESAAVTAKMPASAVDDLVTRARASCRGALTALLAAESAVTAEAPAAATAPKSGTNTSGTDDAASIVRNDSEAAQLRSHTQTNGESALVDASLSKSAAAALLAECEAAGAALTAAAAAAERSGSVRSSSAVAAAALAAEATLSRAVVAAADATAGGHTPIRDAVQRLAEARASLEHFQGTVEAAAATASADAREGEVDEPHDVVKSDTPHLLSPPRTRIATAPRVYHEVPPSDRGDAAKPSSPVTRAVERQLFSTAPLPNDESRQRQLGATATPDRDTGIARQREPLLHSLSGLIQGPPARAEARDAIAHAAHDSAFSDSVRETADTTFPPPIGKADAAGRPAKELAYSIVLPQQSSISVNSTPMVSPKSLSSPQPRSAARLSASQRLQGDIAVAAVRAERGQRDRAAATTAATAESRAKEVAWTSMAERLAVTNAVRASLRDRVRTRAAAEAAARAAAGVSPATLLETGSIASVLDQVHTDATALVCAAEAAGLVGSCSHVTTAIATADDYIDVAMELCAMLTAEGDAKRQSEAAAAAADAVVLARGFLALAQQVFDAALSEQSARRNRILAARTALRDLADARRRCESMESLCQEATAAATAARRLTSGVARQWRINDGDAAIVAAARDMIRRGAPTSDDPHVVAVAADAAVTALLASVLHPAVETSNHHLPSAPASPKLGPVPERLWRDAASALSAATAQLAFEVKSLRDLEALEDDTSDAVSANDAEAVGGGPSGDNRMGRTASSLVNVPFVQSHQDVASPARFVFGSVGLRGDVSELEAAVGADNMLLAAVAPVRSSATRGLDGDAARSKLGFLAFAEHIAAVSSAARAVMSMRDRARMRSRAVAATRVRRVVALAAREHLSSLQAKLTLGTPTPALAALSAAETAVVRIEAATAASVSHARGSNHMESSGGSAESHTESSRDVGSATSRRGTDETDASSDIGLLVEAVLAIWAASSSLEGVPHKHKVDLTAAEHNSPRGARITAAAKVGATKIAVEPHILSPGLQRRLSPSQSRLLAVESAVPDREHTTLSSVTPKRDVRKAVGNGGHSLGGHEPQILNLQHDASAHAEPVEQHLTHHVNDIVAGGLHVAHSQLPSVGATSSVVVHKESHAQLLSSSQHQLTPPRELKVPTRSQSAEYASVPVSLPLPREAATTNSMSLPALDANGAPAIAPTQITTATARDAKRGKGQLDGATKDQLSIVQHAKPSMPYAAAAARARRLSSTSLTDAPPGPVKVAPSSPRPRLMKTDSAAESSGDETIRRANVPGWDSNDQGAGDTLTSSVLGASSNVAHAPELGPGKPAILKSISPLRAGRSHYTSRLPLPASISPRPHSNLTLPALQEIARLQLQQLQQRQPSPELQSVGPLSVQEVGFRAHPLTASAANGDGTEQPVISSSSSASSAASPVPPSRDLEVLGDQRGYNVAELGEERAAERHSLRSPSPSSSRERYRDHDVVERRSDVSTTAASEMHTSEHTTSIAPSVVHRSNKGHDKSSSKGQQMSHALHGRRVSTAGAAVLDTSGVLSTTKLSRARQLQSSGRHLEHLVTDDSASIPVAAPASHAPTDTSVTHASGAPLVPRIRGAWAPPRAVASRLATRAQPRGARVAASANREPSTKPFGGFLAHAVTSSAAMRRGTEAPATATTVALSSAAASHGSPAPRQSRLLLSAPQEPDVQHLEQVDVDGPGFSPQSAARAWPRTLRDSPTRQSREE